MYGTRSDLRGFNGFNACTQVFFIYNDVQIQGLRASQVRRLYYKNDLKNSIGKRNSQFIEITMGLGKQ